MTEEHDKEKKKMKVKYEEEQRKLKDSHEDKIEKQRKEHDKYQRQQEKEWEKKTKKMKEEWKAESKPPTHWAENDKFLGTWYCYSIYPQRDAWSYWVTIYYNGKNYYNNHGTVYLEAGPYMTTNLPGTWEHRVEPDGKAYVGL